MAQETILVIDDSLEIVRVLKNHMLTPLGYQVISASDGQAGLRLATTKNPDLIMLDMSMPRLTGLEVLVALRQTDCQTPVIFMTMHGSEGIVAEAFRLGVRDYLSKPFTLEEVQRAVDRALQEKRLAQAKEELARDLIASETIRQTAVTLAHYINNYLMSLTGSLTLLQESLQQELPHLPGLLKMVQDSQHSAAQISAVIRVLQRVTKAQQATYYGQVRMIDIEAALRDELANPPRPDPHG